MVRHIPHNLLLVLENWFQLGVSCVKWSNVVSDFFELTCGIYDRVECSCRICLQRYGSFSIFQNGGHRPSWIFKTSKFYLPIRYVRLICVSIPNFVHISWSFFGDMTDFRFFKMAAVPHLGFVLRVFGPPAKCICWSLSLCKIWLESVQ